MSETTKIGSVSGYLAKPSDTGPWPALIVIQEWWGLDQQTRSVADRFVKVYPLSGHAFFRDSDSSVYRPEAAQDAWERVTRFFAKNLN